MVVRERIVVPSISKSASGLAQKKPKVNSVLPVGVNDEDEGRGSFAKVTRHVEPLRRGG